METQLPQMLPGGGRRQRTRQRILKAARAVVARRGLEGASVLEVTERAAIGFGSFYNHFGGKEELFQALATELRAELEAVWAGLAARHPDPLAFLAVALRELFARLRREPEWAWSLYRSAPYLLNAPASFRTLADAIRAGIDSRRLPLGDAEAATGVFLGGLLSLIAANLTQPPSEQSPEQLAALCLLPLGVAPEEALALSRA